jgi:glycosyltransferase involved in cell wall biosynthesis
MTKEILIVNQNSGYLAIDVANAFSACNHKVVFFTGYNRVTNRDFNAKIKIHKTIKYNRTSTLKRIFTWGICTLHLFVLILTKYRKYKILYYTNPPISYFNSLIFSNKFSVVVFDTYPDALKLIGFKESNFVFKLWVKVNKNVFKKADSLITLSNGMKSQLINYCEEGKIKVIPIWPASEEFKPIPKQENFFIKNNHIEDKFIILYSGNMGLGHSLELIIDVANQLKFDSKFCFYFIGEGGKKPILMKLVEDMGLTNVYFMTWQSAEVLPFSLASADVAVVALEPAATHLSVPSKTLNYMAVGSPILGIGGKGSELEFLIEKFKVGKYISNTNPDEVVEFIKDLASNKLKASEYSFNSLNAVRNFSFTNSELYLF